MSKVLKSLMVLFVFLLLFSQNAPQASAATNKELLILSHAAYYPYAKDTDPTRAPVFSITKQLNFINSKLAEKSMSKLSSSEYDKLDKSWKRVNRTDLKEFGNGFSGTAFYNFNTSELVFAFRGSEDAQDFLYDADIYTRKLDIKPISNARAFVIDTIKYMVNNGVIRKEKMNTMNITITGHSLGGYLAQKVGMDVIDGSVFPSVINKNQIAKTKIVTFNPLGFRENSVPFGKTEMKNNAQNKYTKQITHNIIKGDIAFEANKKFGLKLIGQKELKTTLSELTSAQKSKIHIIPAVASHSILAFYNKF
jgi:hypothetical protein